MQRRAFDRVSANIPVRFSCCNVDYTGIIIDLSENGMYINMHEMSFPFDSRLEIIIPLNAIILKVPVEVSRITKTGNIFNGMGVYLSNAPEDYLDFVRQIKSEPYT
jgi:hypothetical protein